MIQFSEFERLVRDAMSNLFDIAALETHALNSILVKPADYPGKRAEYLRQTLIDAVEALKPAEKGLRSGSAAWRSYLVLKGRYVEGLSLIELRNRLCLSERQLRRENSRAISALATILWEKYCLKGDDTAIGIEPKPLTSPEHLTAYQATLEKLNLAQLMEGVRVILTPRLQAENADLILDIPSDLPLVVSDRIILRQILLGLLGLVLQKRSCGNIHLDARAEGNSIALHIRFKTNESPILFDDFIDHDHGSLRYWIEQINACLTSQVSASLEEKTAELKLVLPQKAQPVLLVVDDHEAAIQLIQRYLQDTEFRIIGVQEPEQVLLQMLKLRPRAVLLDVMMPSIDGWEILQSLKADPATATTPVLICSVWNEPELAFSLGAADYLKKPFSQQDLLQALARLNLLDNEDEAGSAGP